VSGVAAPAAVALPTGYAEERERGAQVVALPSVMSRVCSAVREGGTLYDWAASLQGARAFTGRGAAYAVETGAGTWVVRHYRRGGAVARLLGDRYARLGEARPLRELTASAAARSRGVPTPEVLAAVIYPAGAFYRADLATAYVPDSADLAETTLGPAREDGPGRLQAWWAAGSLLRTAFDAGIEHADLNLRNILITRTADGVGALLLDLDRAIVHPGPVSAATRAALLRRLHRSRRKLERALGRATPDAELAALDAALEGVRG
jgi:3-deoxy-D-manno-octulosonic acid kinase